MFRVEKLKLDPDIAAELQEICTCLCATSQHDSVLVVTFLDTRQRIIQRLGDRKVSVLFFGRNRHYILLSGNYTFLSEIYNLQCCVQCTEHVDCTSRS